MSPASDGRRGTSLARPPQPALVWPAGSQPPDEVPLDSDAPGTQTPPPRLPMRRRSAIHRATERQILAREGLSPGILVGNLSIIPTLARRPNCFVGQIQVKSCNSTHSAVSSGVVP